MKVVNPTNRVREERPLLKAIERALDAYDAPLPSTGRVSGSHAKPRIEPGP
jgi:hypothetical protein